MKSFLMTVLVCVAGVSAQASSLDLKFKENVQVNCQDSIPFLTGNVVSCETLCQVQVTETYVQDQECDQSCWPVTKFYSSEVKVVKYPQNKVLFSRSGNEKSLVDVTVNDATAVAARACSKFEVIKK